MRHRKGYKKLGRPTGPRLLMLRNLAKALITYEKIRTTEARAKALRPVVEKIITLGKKGTLHHRRLAIARLGDPKVVAKVFDELAVRYADRPGGYTRITKLGPRLGDGAPMALIELVE